MQNKFQLIRENNMRRKDFINAKLEGDGGQIVPQNSN